MLHLADLEITSFVSIEVYPLALRLLDQFKRKVCRPESPS